MPTNYEWLLHMDGEERQAWFDAEHVDNTKSAKRAAAVERLKATGYRIAGVGYERSRYDLTTAQLNAIAEIIEKGDTK